MAEDTGAEIRVVCSNKKCRYSDASPVIEINFYSQDIMYVCPRCGQESSMYLQPQSQPLPKTRTSS